MRGRWMGEVVRERDGWEGGGWGMWIGREVD